MRLRNAFLRGIVHVSFPGGGLFLPVRTPYDRQTLVEHVKDRVRSKGEVQVLMPDDRWVVRMSRDATRPKCTACGTASESACQPSTHAADVYCVSCAFGSHPVAA